MTGIFQINSLRVEKDGVTVCSLDARIAGGEILTIMGPSGSGKSTLLSALLGTLAADFSLHGQIRLGDRTLNDVPPHQRRVGLLFQDHVLFPHLSVAENLAFAIPPEIKGRKLRMTMVEEALETAGLSGFGPRDPDKLSGGQKARIALMRALLARPCALLLDEPFTGLDAALRMQLRSYVFDLLRARQIPTILVTHDAEDAIAAGGAILTPQGKALTLPDATLP